MKVARTYIKAMVGKKLGKEWHEGRQEKIYVLLNSPHISPL